MQSTRSAKHASISSTLRHIASNTGSFPKSLPDLKQNNFIGSFYQFGCDIRNKSYKQNVQIKKQFKYISYPLYIHVHVYITFNQIYFLFQIILGMYMCQIIVPLKAIENKSQI